MKTNILKTLSIALSAIYPITIVKSYQSRTDLVYRKRITHKGYSIMEEIICNDLTSVYVHVLYVDTYKEVLEYKEAMLFSIDIINENKKCLNELAKVD